MASLNVADDVAFAVVLSIIGRWKNLRITGNSITFPDASSFVSIRFDDRRFPIDYNLSSVSSRYCPSRLNGNIAKETHRELF